MARRKTARPGGSNGSCRDGDGLLDVVVVILEGGYTSTAVAPIEIFHSAGVVWNWLHGEAAKQGDNSVRCVCTSFAFPTAGTPSI